jgi:hypothetical protein
VKLRSIAVLNKSEEEQQKLKDLRKMSETDEPQAARLFLSSEIGVI